MLRVDEYAAEGALNTREALLADLTGCTYLLVSGANAPAFSELALAGDALGVGDARFEAVLTGDGALLGAPLAIRTGDHETVVIDSTRVHESVGAWVEYLAQARDARGIEAFPEVEVEDASEMLVPLLLLGELAREVLLDYLHNGDELPEPGTTRQLRLDAITCVVTSLDLPQETPAFLLLVPPGSARILWRSLLSFTEVTPVGHRALSSLLSRILPWGSVLDGSGPARVSREQLEDWGIVREGADFVGGRGLA